MKILSWDTRAVLYETSACSSVGEAVERAVADGVDLSRADLFAQDLSGRQLPGALLYAADLRFSNCDRVNWTGAVMDCVMWQGATALDARLLKVSAYGGNLTGMCMDGSDARGLDAPAATFHFAQARRTNFGFAGFCGSDWTGAEVPGASYFGCDLRLTRWTAAKLAGVNMQLADLDGAGPADAAVRRVVLGGARNVPEGWTRQQPQKRRATGRLRSTLTRHGARRRGPGG